MARLPHLAYDPRDCLPRRRLDSWRSARCELSGPTVLCHMMSSSRWTLASPTQDEWDTAVPWNIRVSATAARALTEIDLASLDLLDQLASVVTTMLPRTRVEILLADPARPLPRRHGAGEGHQIAGSVPRSADHEALARREPIELQAADVRAVLPNKDETARNAKRWVVIAPLLAGEIGVGVMHVWSLEADVPLSADECQLVRAIADPIARTIDAASRLERSTRMADEQAGLLRVSRAAASSLDLKVALPAIARAVIGLANTERCVIGLHHAEADQLEICADESAPDWPGADPPGRRIAIDQWPAVQQAMRSHHAVWSTGEQDQSRLLADDHALVLTTAEGQSLLAVPLLADERSVGVLILFAQERAAFGRHEAQIGQTIGSYAMSTIRHEWELRDSQRHAAAQAAMLRVSRAASISHDFPFLISEIARAGLGIAGAEASGIYFWRPENDHLEVGAEETVASWPGVAHAGEKLPLENWPTARTALIHGETMSFAVEDPFLHAAERQMYEASGVKNVLIVPVMLGTERLGLLELFSRTTHHFSAVDIHLAQELAAQAAQTLDRARLQDVLQHRANTDGLTGLLNHRAVQEDLNHALTVSELASEPLAVLIVDINDFKLFNDTHGHQVGDEVLVQTATLLRDVVGETVHVGRYGGDEFLIVAPRLDHRRAVQMADRLLTRARSTSIRVGEHRLPLEFSIGLAAFPSDGLTAAELIAAADSEMYAAKHGNASVIPILNLTSFSADPAPLDALFGLVQAVDRKDRYTRRHGDLVTVLALRFAAELGLDDASSEALAIAGPLHDVGKIALPEAVLRKPGRLNEQEQELLRQHVTFGEALIHNIPDLDLVRTAIASHHERWDGAGYPRGLQGTEIPLIGRVLALADAYAAMVLDRPYRKGWPIRRALAAIRSGAGSQFDPTLTERFVVIAKALGAETSWARGETHPSSAHHEAPAAAIARWSAASIIPAAQKS